MDIDYISKIQCKTLYFAQIIYKITPSLNYEINKIEFGKLEREVDILPITISINQLRYKKDYICWFENEFFIHLSMYDKTTFFKDFSDIANEQVKYSQTLQ